MIERDRKVGRAFRLNRDRRSQVTGADRGLHGDMASSRGEELQGVRGQSADDCDGKLGFWTLLKFVFG